MVSGRVVQLSLRGAMVAGAVGGFVFGLFAGGVLGALVSWFSGAIVDWQAQLGYSLGVTEQLLPLGDQIPGLRAVADRWYLVIPAVALLIGVIGAVIGTLAAGLWAALVNRQFLPLDVTIRSPVMVPDRRVAQRRDTSEKQEKASGE
jgi:hypothetical protein